MPQPTDTPKGSPAGTPPGPREPGPASPPQPPPTPASGAGRAAPESGPTTPGGPPERATEQTGGPPAQFSRRAVLWAAGGGLASAVVGAVVAEVASRLTSPDQAVRDDRAVEAAKQSAAQQKPPLSVNAYYYDRSDDASVCLFPVPLTGEQRHRLLDLPRTPTTVTDLAATGDGVDTVYPGDQRHPYRLFTRVRLSVVGQWTGPVFVTQIRARVQRRSAPLSGAYVFEGSQGGGEPLKIGFDLDEPDSIARVVTEKLELGAAYVDGHSLTLSPGEPLTVDVQAQTDRSYCEWVIELDVDLGGERRVLTVDDDGRPFRSSSLARNYQERYYAKITGGWGADGPGAFEGRS
ncbi:hypothetical protein ACGFI4_22245 [Micromonospora carbonacea]|uniref:hypothetical protein n=1 Tax=Micromonospora carbonacea TaxID=47853 RepID=UPI00370FF8D2